MYIYIHIHIHIYLLICIDNLAYPKTPPVTTAAEPTWNETLSMAHKVLF